MSKNDERVGAPRQLKVVDYIDLTGSDQNDLHVFQHHSIVVSIDIGHNNMGICVIDSNDNGAMQILHWQLHSLTNVRRESIGKNLSNQIAFGINLILKNLFRELSIPLSAIVVVVEEQLKYIFGKSNDMTILANSVAEACIFAFCYSSCIKSASIHPGTVKAHWKIVGTGIGKKKAAIALVQDLLMNPSSSTMMLTCPPKIREMYLQSPKKDDLADCILQALYAIKHKLQ